MNSNIISLLKIPGFFVLDVKVEGEEIVISARKRAKTAKHPACMKRSKILKDYLPVTKVLHMMLCNQKVYLSFRKRRFICVACRKIFVEQITFLPRYQRRTVYASNHALERLSDSSFNKTKERIGVSYGGLTSLLKKAFTLEKIDWQGQKVKEVIHLGIDEHHFGKRNKYLITIANLLTGKPIHILPDDKQKTLTAFLRQLSSDIKESI